jgi:hypothetical protein
MAGNQQKRNIRQEINQSLEILKQIYDGFSYFPYAYKDPKLYSRLYEFRSTLGDLLSATKSEEHNKEFAKLTEEGCVEYNRLLTQLIERITKGKDDNIIVNYARSEERKNPVRPDHKLSMKEAGLPEIGPCAFRALLAVAETRSGKNLTRLEVLAVTKNLQEKKVVSSNWNVGANKLEIINASLEMLGHNERAVSYTQGHSPENVIPGDVDATIIHTMSNNPGNNKHYEHFAEGNLKGDLLWDPVGFDTFNGAIIDRVDYIKFKGLENR